MKNLEGRYNCHSHQQLVHSFKKLSVVFSMKFHDLLNLNIFLLASFSRKNISKDEKQSVVSEVLSIVKGKESDVSIAILLSFPTSLVDAHLQVTHGLLFKFYIISDHHIFVHWCIYFI